MLSKPKIDLISEYEFCFIVLANVGDCVGAVRPENNGVARSRETR